MEKILGYLNNYFYRFGERGKYTIEDNVITVRGKYIEGQYVRLTGSVMNDGVYKVISVDENSITLNETVNEVFEGIIYSLAIPKELIELEKKINKFVEDNPAGGYASESFGNYSYSKGTNANGELNTWKDVFKVELRPYKKMYDVIRRVKLI